MQPIIAQIIFQGEFVFNYKDFSPPTDFWLESITPVELIFINKKAFERLWEVMKKKDCQYIVDLFKQHEITKKICKQTIYRLAYDIVTVKKFNKGDIILTYDNPAEKAKNSNISFEGYEYDDQSSKA